MDGVSGTRPGALSAKEIAELLAREFSQMAGRDSPNIIEDAWQGGCRVRRKFRESSLRPGGTISGPTMMGLTDFAMYVAVLASIGPVPLAVVVKVAVSPA